MTDQTKKEASASLWIKLQTCLLAAVLVLLVVCTLLLAGSMKKVDRSLELVQADLENLNMDQVNEAVASLTEAANRLAAVDVEGFNKTAESLKAASDSLAKVDVETLNKAISSLQQAADTLKDLDMDSLNAVIGSLSKTVASLQKVADTIGGIFGR